MTQKKRQPVKTTKPGPSTANRPAAKPITAQTAAQKRLAAQRAMAAASGVRSARRKRLMTVVVAPIAVVIIVVAVIVIVAATRGSSTSVPHTPTAASAALQKRVTTVPASVFNTVGTGSGVNAPSALSGAPLTGGKNKLPRVLYVGAEWCPLCGAERWALAAALSRFGTLTGLQTTYSTADSDETYRNVPTLTFAKATYTSSLITTTLVELQNGAKKTVGTLTSADAKLFTTIGQSGFPFIDIGGKYVVSGVSYSPAVLAGKTHMQIATAMADPTSKIAQSVDGTANYITAAICAATGQKPGNVCSSAGVKAAAAALKSNS